MDTAVMNLQSLYETMRQQVHSLNDTVEPSFIRMAQNFDTCRRKWQRTEEELGSCKVTLTKAQTEKGALEVKLKHARNQVEVEIRRRQKAEEDCEKLDRQIQLMRDLLTSEGSSNSIQLSAEQRSALAFLNTNYRASPAANGNTSHHRLQTIDESLDSILSDISYDKTDDSLDWDASSVRTLHLKKRQKRRSSRNLVDGPPSTAKRIRSKGLTERPVNESLVTTTTVTVPANGGPVEAVSTIETVPYWTRSRRQTAALDSDSESLKSDDVFNVVVDPEVKVQPSTPQNFFSVRLHDFVSKTVIKPESCVPCGKRIKFGKLSIRCRDCKVVSHPECKERCPLPCVPNPCGTPAKLGEAVLADYAPDSSPSIPPLVIRCVNEIEQRGLREAGLYRVSGSDRVVKELKEKFLRSRSVPVLSKVDDIHCVTGLLKDFLRNLKEPLLTFRLNQTFMNAAEISDEDNSCAEMYQIISDLPNANRDTLAFLILHLQRVAESLETRMDSTNLARIFGPTIVGHAVANPDPMTILGDTKRQPMVVTRLLSLPSSYWKQFVNDQHIDDHLVIHNSNCYQTPERGTILIPPENHFNKTPSSSSLTQRVMSSLTPRFGSKSKLAANMTPRGKFFESPQLK